MEYEIKFIVCFVLSVLFLSDILLKFRFKPGHLLEDIGIWGILSPVYLAIMGGISIFVVGWVGWLLLVVASFCATDLVRFRHTLDKPGEDAKERNYRLLQVKQFQAYLLVVSELICCGYTVSHIFGLFNTVLSNFH